MAQALVEFDYDAVEPDELTIRKGDIIADVKSNSKGWWEGTLTKDGKRGVFPDNFVKLISDPNGLASALLSPTSRKCKVLFSYKPSNEDELELHVGDIIDIISEVEEGWWKGKLKNGVGVFPSNFVQELINANETREASQRKLKVSPFEANKTLPGNSVDPKSSNSHAAASETSASPDIPLLPPKPVKEVCKVIFPYMANNPDELTLNDGDIITLITKDGQDVGWWKGECKGKIGLFPDNFVEIISAPEETSPMAKPERPSKNLPSNKAKDSINKLMTSSMSNIASISRKYSDNVKPDEKMNHPLLSKKPVLPPPPLKKPQRSSSDLAKSPTAPNLLSSKPDTSPSMLPNVKSPTNQVSGLTSTSIRTSSSSSENVTVNSSVVTNSKRSTIEKMSDSLDGGLFSKSGSYSITSEINSYSLSSAASNATGTVIAASGDSELDLVSRAAMLTHPTASRVKAPKRRPPSAIYTSTESNNLEEGSETAKSSLSTSVSSTTITTMLNGDTEAHNDKPASKVPWVEELKLNQAKKSLQAGNKTRVMIGGSETASTIQSVTTSVSATNISTSAGNITPEAIKPPSQTISGVTLRSHQPSTSSSTSGSTRPHSMVSSFKSGLVSPQSNDSGLVPAKLFNDLMEKMVRLEELYESKVDIFNKSVKELKEQLEEERHLRTSNVESFSTVVKDLKDQLEVEKQLRIKLQQEVDKLSNFVTQV